MAQNRAEREYKRGFYYLLAGRKDQAEQWIRSAAQSGHPEAIHLLESGARLGVFSSSTLLGEAHELTIKK